MAWEVVVSAVASKEALFACALANTPACVRVVRIRKNLTGVAYTNPKHHTYGRLEAPRPVTRRALQTFLHECAHFVLHSGSSPKKPRYLQELEAEQWAHARMREAGIPVSRKMVQAAKEHVRNAIWKAVKSGADRIDAKAKKFAGIEGTPVFIWKVSPTGLARTNQPGRRCKCF